MSNTEKQIHDRVAHYVAKTRFPFAGQTDWPEDYKTIVNAGKSQLATRVRGYTHYPDILVVDGNGNAMEIGEIEMQLKPEFVPRLTLSSMAVPIIQDSGVRHFFLYVPAEIAEMAQKFVESYRISLAGLRTFAIDENDEISIMPLETKGHPKDHRET